MIHLRFILTFGYSLFQYWWIAELPLLMFVRVVEHLSQLSLLPIQYCALHILESLLIAWTDQIWLGIIIQSILDEGLWVVIVETASCVRIHDQCVCHLRWILSVIGAVLHLGIEWYVPLMVVRLLSTWLRFDLWLVSRHLSWQKAANIPLENILRWLALKDLLRMIDHGLVNRVLLDHNVWVLDDEVVVLANVELDHWLVHWLVVKRWWLCTTCR